MLRFAAFLLSALYAGAAGALYVHTIRVISPEVLEFPIMVSCLTMAVIGGRARIAGAIVGAVLLVHLPEWLRILDRGYLVAYGAALLACVILAPDGVIGLLERGRARLFPTPRLPAPSPLAPPPRRPAETSGPVLAVNGLTKSFGGVEALAGVALEVARGEILGLIGPNGSGKTTLVNLVSGIGRKDAGIIRLDGVAIDDLPAHAIARRGIGRSFQTGNLVASMSVLDTVAVARLAVTGGIAPHRALGLYRGDRDLAQARREAMDALALLGVADVAGESCGALTVGIARRVEIARALALEPLLLLLDEPAAGLTEAEQSDLARRLADLARKGLAVLVVEHNMAFLMPLAHRIACLERGRIIAIGKPEEIRRDRRVIEAYLGIAAAVPA